MLAAFQELGSVPAVERPLEVCVSRTHFKFAKCIYNLSSFAKRPVWKLTRVERGMET